MTDDLHDKLHRAVPDAPDARGWAAAARRRSTRTRRTVVAGGVTVAVLALVLAIGWATLTGHGRRGVPAATPIAGGPSIPSATPASAVVPDGCDGLTPSTSGAVPARADRLRLCPTGWSLGRVFTPLDTLDGDRTAEALRALSSQSRIRSDQPCRLDRGPDFLLVAERDGQAPVVMTLQLYGCRVVGVADDLRTGATVVYNTFRKQLGAQRAAEGSPLSPRDGDACGTLTEPQSSVMQVEPIQATTATLCLYTTQSGAARQVALGDLVEWIAFHIDNHNSDATSVACPTLPEGTLPLRLALTNQYGDVLQLNRTCGEKWFYDTDLGERVWTPSAELTRRLNQLAKG